MKKEMTFKDLKQCFKEAFVTDAEFIGVLKEVPEIAGKDLIVTGKEDFVDKLVYYAAEFNNEELKHRYVEGERIVNFAYGQSFADLEEKLMEKQTETLMGHEKGI